METIFIAVTVVVLIECFMLIWAYKSNQKVLNSCKKKANKLSDEVDDFLTVDFYTTSKN